MCNFLLKIWPWSLIKVVWKENFQHHLEFHPKSYLKHKKWKTALWYTALPSTHLSICETITGTIWFLTKTTFEIGIFLNVLFLYFCSLCSASLCCYKIWCRVFLYCFVDFKCFYIATCQLPLIKYLSCI